MDFFIDKGNVPTIRAALFESRFYGVGYTVFRTLIYDTLRPAKGLSVWGSATSGKLRYKIHHHSGFAIAGVTLEKRYLANSNEGVPEPSDIRCLNITVERYEP